MLWYDSLIWMDLGVILDNVVMLWLVYQNLTHILAMVALYKIEKSPSIPLILFTFILTIWEEFHMIDFNADGLKLFN